MSWLVVFISYLSPVLLLVILLAMDRHPRSSRATPSPLRIRRRDGADNKDGTRRPTIDSGRDRHPEEEAMRPRILTLLIFAGTLALAIAAGQDLSAQTSRPQVTTLLKTEVAGVEGKEWNVITVELAPGAVNARYSYPGIELVYVLEGAGFLEVHGKPPVALNPGVVAALNPKQIHILKNTSQTQTLKVVVVLLLEKGQQRPILAKRGAPRHQGGGDPISNGDLRQQKANEQKHSTLPGLVF